MAAESPLESLQDEATCSVCLEFFKDLQMLMDCGHNVCGACITQCWEGLVTDVCCPQCRQSFPQRNLSLKRQLENGVEIAKHAPEGTEEQTGSGEPQEALKRLCTEDGSPICLVCDGSPAHPAPPIVPIEEAAQEYKQNLQACLKTLREERDKLLQVKLSGEGRTQEYLKQARVERQKIVFEFQQLRQFLEEQECLLLAQLGMLEKDMEKVQGEKVTKISEEISCLSELIIEVEGKCQQSSSDLLQEIRNTLSRCEKGKFQHPGELSPELGRRLWDFSQKTLILQEILRKFKDTLISDLEKKRGDMQETYTKVKVTLNPDTANPWLLLSADRKSVRLADAQQDLPNNPQRFDLFECVLGCEGFTLGRHFWEVEVGQGEAWAVGVARESVRRKGLINFNPEGGIWAVQLWLGQFRALTAPDRTPLPLGQVPSRVRVCLDCAGGWVSFLDAGTKAPIFTFPPASFAEERIHPWLWVGPGVFLGTSELKLCH
ncbi:zinc finger protein RFP-like [Alligator sinensis]|uniref:Zinc finger protein RFP-like n=1 Tax=Alligator sinensis TaxID=38654 RepID=A0A3Q0GB44_ALLSI|nr:zinc finger protein RFP-like [Alligator sinensis]